MKTVDINYRILYADTDAMGIVYYANYLRFYEMGRDAYLRSLNMSEESMKSEGVIFPAISVDMQYLMPAQLKDVVIVKTGMVEVPQVRLLFNQSVIHPEKGLLNEANITLAAVNPDTMRPCRCPHALQQAVKALL
ncbi:MAG: acyl-CoA thioesterase [Bacteroidales bacterium]|jgi:acyl-CoA thioester hydrolase